MNEPILPKYILADPIGNRTVLVTEPVPEPEQRTAARRLLELEPSAEQVGFLSAIEENRISLRMSGGEFCGNATVSAAAYALSLSGKEQGTITVTVSGAKKPLPVKIRRARDGFAGVLSLPLPEAPETVSLPFRGGETSFPLVRMPGICHIMLASNPDRDAVQEAIRSWCGILGCEALGALFLSPSGDTLVPLVYVANTGTLYWENSCSSGSCAAAWWLSQYDGNKNFFVFQQPGGRTAVQVTATGLQYSGCVRFL